MNSLYYGDNLSVLRAASMTRVWIWYTWIRRSTARLRTTSSFAAPPASSHAPRSRLSRTLGTGVMAELAFDGVMTGQNTDPAEMLRVMRAFLKESDMMAYLSMMAIRLSELHRVLKPTGSLYLHCDSTASHCLKLVMDAIFGPANFVSVR